ncbi:MAG: uracil-DNA glycosylase [Nitrospirae bacterium]|nr:uracil-DNA glycosylase [Magnetococcales bacterium]
MNISDLTATLEYWLTAGIDVFSCERLQFPQHPKSLQESITPAPGRSQPSQPPIHPFQHPDFPEEKTVLKTPPATAQSSAKIVPLAELVTKALPPEERATQLNTMAQSLAQCTRCNLAHMRTNMVFGVGSTVAPVVFVGEGPGAEEDLRGQPFVGDAGKLLDKMIHAIQLQRQLVYIANVVKCRPPGNRNPLPSEIEQCQPFLFEQLETIRPQVIFALGKFAIHCLTGLSGPIESIRGQTPRWRGIPVIPSYHPAFYLRTPSRKKAAWEDLLRLKKMLTELGSTQPSPRSIQDHDAPDKPDRHQI